MVRTKTGRYEPALAAGLPVQAFIPLPLPPTPSLEMTGSRQALLEQALLALGRLDGLMPSLPDAHQLLYSYIRREAVLSSQIEGTQSSLSDLLLFEIKQAPGLPMDDVVEVSNYVAAMEHGRARLHDSFPISNRLIRELHQRLMGRGRGRNRQPGAFRDSQVWLGTPSAREAQFIPPPPTAIADCMAALEAFIHDQSVPYPVLIKAALIHAQFETIHPFLDGNGRVGRLLIPLLLVSGGVLSQSILYLSLFFKENRLEYYKLLDLTRTQGDWEAWIDFFLIGVASTAAQAVEMAGRLRDLVVEDQERIRTTGRRTGSALRVHEILKQRVIVTIRDVGRRSGLSFPAASSGMQLLLELGQAKEVTGLRRNRIFVYERYLNILNEGTEVLPR
ncbi:MAG: Fic family protein [Sulfobacillus sp.]